MSTDPPPDPPVPVDDFDVHALLSVALDQAPSVDIADRVVNRLALIETATELARLFGLAPASVVSEAVRSPRAEREPTDEGDDADS